MEVRWRHSSPRHDASHEELCASSDDEAMSRGVVDRVAAWGRQRAVDDEESSQGGSPLVQQRDRLSPSVQSRTEPSPRLSPVAAVGDGTRQLERRRSQLSVERVLVERDRERLETLLARHQRTSSSPPRSPFSPRSAMRCTAASTQQQQSQQQMSPGVPPSLSPIRAVTFHDESPRSPSRGSPASQSRRGPHRSRAASDWSDSGCTLDERDCDRPEGRSASTAYVREVTEGDDHVDYDGAAEEPCVVGGIAAEGRENSPVVEHPQRPAAAAQLVETPLPRQQVEETRASGQYYAKKLHDIAEARRRSGVASHPTASAGALGYRPVSLSAADMVFQRRGRILTPRWPQGELAPLPQQPLQPAFPNFPWQQHSMMVVPPPMVERRPRLCWDLDRSGNVVVSPDGICCVAESSRARRAAAEEYPHLRGAAPIDTVIIPMYALGTVGIATGAFAFQVRLGRMPDASSAAESGIWGHRSGRAFASRFAVGVTTRKFRGAQKDTCAYLYTSDGVIVSGAGSELFRSPLSQDAGVVVEPYGAPYGPGDSVTVVLQLSACTLSFLRNGEEFGPAFTFNVPVTPEPLFPVVIFARDGDGASFEKPTV